MVTFREVPDCAPLLHALFGTRRLMAHTHSRCRSPTCIALPCVSLNPKLCAAVFEQPKRALVDRFYRGENSRDGAGLGLSIVKSIMSLHHGTVQIASEPGKGTTVVLRFPVDETQNR